MSNEAAFHDGYRKALEEISGLVSNHDRSGELTELTDEIERRIERARHLSRASVAAQAGGKQGY